LMTDVRNMRQQGAILVVAAHPDDEVLGCGGTLALMSSHGRSVHVLLLADGESSRAPSNAGHQIDSARIAARNVSSKAACRIMGCSSVDLLALPDNRLDGLELLDIVKHVEAFVQLHQPSTVLTHWAGDVNIDHRVVHEAVIAACRPQPGHPVKELLFFEVPSSTEWRPAGTIGPFIPNWFVDISMTLAKKLEALQTYESELRAFPHPRSARAVEALARWRGATVGVEAAEAFVLGRNIVQPE
jgi:LmbE family N-acetylglucosaminyl deacetylase